jgi:hypothetical protein
MADVAALLQGSSMLRFLLVEAAQVTVRSLPEWRSKYFHLMLRRGRKIAKVAMAAVKSKSGVVSFRQCTDLLGSHLNTSDSQATVGVAVHSLKSKRKGKRKR